jgi:predicted dienelactone hydrolase
MNRSFVYPALTPVRSPSPPRSRSSFLRQGLIAAIAPLLCLAPEYLVPKSVNAAERITLYYGPLARSISVSSLSTYAKEGKIDRELRSYLRQLEEPQQQQLRRILRMQANLDHVTVAQFLYSQQGRVLLQKLGEVIRTDSDQSGFYALRSALILAASEPEGLNVVTAMEKFPLEGVRIDLRQAFQIIGNLETLIRQTQDATDLIEQQAKLEANVTTALGLPDLRQPGSLISEKQSLTLTDRRNVEGKFQRDRTFTVDLYLPQTKDQKPVANAPLIIISHGLGSDRNTYSYLARHLASYGFAVAVPEHPGSNARQIQDLFIGAANNVIPPDEFINRPLDVKYLLDQLDEQSQTNPLFTGRYLLNRVGIVGQSMGGYTGLALAGAKINPQQLRADCQTSTLNLSLLIQCRALELSTPLPTLKDDRIQAVIAINPIGSSLLGKNDFGEIQVPTMIISSTADTIAPAILEQIRPFTWLKTRNKYLVLLTRGTHFSTIDVPRATSSATVQLPPELVGPNPAIAHTYLRSITLAFFRSHITQDVAYQRYLESAYAQQISQPALPLVLVRSLTPAQLAKVFREQPLEAVDPGNSWLGSQPN